MFTRVSAWFTSLVMLISSLLGIPFGDKTAPKDLITYNSQKTTAIIALESNPSTGYNWEYEISDPAVLKAADDQFISGNSSGIVGAPGTRVISFKGLKEGTATIVFRYLRSWEDDPPVNTVVIKFTVAADKTLTAEEVPAGEVITDVEQVVAAYNAACVATKNPPKGKQNLQLDGAVTADGLLGVLLRFISPAVDRAIPKNTMTIDCIPGNPPVLVEDVVKASLISANGTTTIMIKLKDQFDGLDTNPIDGPVGRGVGTIGNLGNSQTAFSVSSEKRSDAVDKTYTDAFIRCTVDENSGAIIGGTWHFRVTLHVDKAVIKQNGITFNLKNLSASFDYEAVI